MPTQYFDPVHAAVENALHLLAHGVRPAETQYVDLKEEAGRRTPDGALLPGGTQNEEAARALAPELACMSNTPPHAGALVFGVADTGEVLGTELDEVWLQERLAALLDYQVTPTVTVRPLAGKRIMVLRVPPATTPVLWQGRVRWRIDDQCQHVDPQLWRTRRDALFAHDWFAGASGIPADRIRTEAVQIARDFLAAGGDQASQTLSKAPKLDLYNALGIIANDSTLTRTGALLFVGRETPVLNYVRRLRLQGPIAQRVRLEGVSMLEELREVFAAFDVNNRRLPLRAAHEAIVNAVIHRNWHDPAPVVVEHTGEVLRVTSPGGFTQQADPLEVLEHPPATRNPTLVAALRELRITASAGRGLNAMFAAMRECGFPEPSISELHRAAVKVTLTPAEDDSVPAA